MCEIVKNVCKWIPKAENGTGKLFFGSVIQDHGNNTVPETFARACCFNVLLNPRLFCYVINAADTCNYATDKTIKTKLLAQWNIIAGKAIAPSKISGQGSNYGLQK